MIHLLVDNALKFSDEVVEIHVNRDDDLLAFTVRDYGIGIAQDQMDTIFETFYQVDSSATRRYGGMGVGLAIVRLILDYHDAQIDVESLVGEGSEFSFKLPIYVRH